MERRGFAAALIGGLAVLGICKASTSKSSKKTLRAGTVVKIKGLPVRLTHDTEIETSDSSWAMIQETDEQLEGGSS